MKLLGPSSWRTHYFDHYTSDPEKMTDLPKTGREELVGKVLPTMLTEVKRLQTDDGKTVKFLWRLFDGALVESVLMRYTNRITLCVFFTGRLWHETVRSVQPGRRG